MSNPGHIRQGEALRAMAGKRGWLTRASVLSGCAGALLATLYGLLTLRFPKGTTMPFALFAGAALIIAVVLSEIFAVRRLSTVRKLGDGSVTADALSLAQAAREAASAPDLLFKNNLINWVMAAAGVAIALRLSFEVPWSLSGRIMLLGLLFGPMTSVLGYVLTTLRVRSFHTQLGQLGLSVQELSDALPPDRAQLQQRLILFTAISVVTTFIITADVAVTVAERGMEKLLLLDDPDAQAKVAAQVHDEVVEKVVMLAAAVLAFALMTALFAARALAEPVTKVAELAGRISTGDLSRAELVPAEDELWAVSSSFAKMHSSLAHALEQLTRAGLRIGTTTEQIVVTSSRYEAGATEQAAALNQTSATTEELARSARQIAENATSVAEIASQTLAAAQTGQASATEFNKSMARVRQDNGAIADAVARLSRRVQQIRKVVSFINGVADRSDLLALNAELEGTKAGEVGRGFSLVAGEMRRLAENVIESTREIEEIIEEIREATDVAVHATEGGVAVTEQGAALAADVSRSLEDIVTLAEQTSGSVRAISLATQQQQSGTDQLAEAMADILRVTQKSLQGSKQVTAANAELSSLSRELKDVVSRFELRKSDGDV